MAGRGGKRPNAGRKAYTAIALTAKSVPIEKPTAALILSQVDEKGLWAKHLTSADARVSLEALKYLCDKRDGKAIQPTSNDTRVKVEADSKAREMTDDELIAVVLDTTPQRKVADA